MEKVYTDITLDLYKENYVEVRAKQYDARTRIIRVTIVNMEKVVTIGSNVTARLAFTKPDRKGVLADCEIVDNKVNVELKEGMLSAAGTTVADIVLTENGEVLSTMRFGLKIESAALQDSTVKSSDEYSALETVLLKAEENEEKYAKRMSELENHLENKSNPHGVTKTQVGLGNVPNVATNDQAPTYSAATTLAPLTSGEKLSISLGKIMKAISDLISHIGNKSNPHAVTKTQVGLGNVPNVATNDQTPTYSAASTLATLTSGEKLNISLGKVMKAISVLMAHVEDKNNPHGITADQIGEMSAESIREHTENKSNPHGVTKTQVGLGNVPNVSTNDQAPTYSAASTLVTLASGEKLSISLGKVMKAISTLISHVSTKATASVLGHVQLSNSAAITATGTYALDAVEKNASVAGTLANQYAELNNNYADMDKDRLRIKSYYNSYTVSAVSTRVINLTGTTLGVESNAAVDMIVPKLIVSNPSQFFVTTDGWDFSNRKVNLYISNNSTSSGNIDTILYIIYHMV